MTAATTAPVQLGPSLTQVNIDQELIAKYDVPGPRYTSYPSALQFADSFSEADYRGLWQPRKLGDSQPLSLYVHLPFCENICYYCACNKVVTRDKQQAAIYLGHLEKEIRMQAALAGSGRPVTQLHWGGGTPTFLSAAEMTELMHYLAVHFQLLDSDHREYAIEIDPRTVDRSALALLKGLGFNRISLGIQDFDEDVQRAINRVQPLAQVCETVDAVRALGYRSLSFDLIYGLPLQSHASFEQTLRRVIALAPDRVALYNYAHLPERFSSQRAIERLALPQPLAKLGMLELAMEMLDRAGYRHIGMDHFALPSDDLVQAQERGALQRNFQGYSVNLAPDLIGVGVSAISATSQGFAQNARDLNDYYARLDAGRLPVTRGLRLNTDDHIRQFVIMQIICNLNVRFDTFQQRFGIAFHDYFESESRQLELLRIDGLLHIDDRMISVTERGRPLLRNICMSFDRYLSAGNGSDATPPISSFSRTI